MFRKLQNVFSISFCIFSLILIAGCAGTTGGKAFTHSEPVADPDFHVSIYNPVKTWEGTTLLADNHRRDLSRIVEVNMQGQIVWEYALPAALKEYTNPGFDVEWLPNDHILFVLPRKGVYEINRAGDVVWSHPDSNVSHDADRLPNGNTLISPRNFNLVVEVDPLGAVTRIIGEGIFSAQHDPEMLPNGDLLVANHQRPHRAVEVDPKTGDIVWQSPGFEREATPVRDADRLPNGNTLVTASTKIVEFTEEGQIVWQFELRNVHFGNQRDRAGLGFYKAERIPPH